ncbi:hypothetical protein CC80DRAFT_508414 [Byssothecium circinans]|uniref:Tat pathway signal sequence n=1 Tax=Byssothecium circinans TaxID=147558 RepID=A0A6A5THJ5_9PLEO|nr:hypothetical protein CC80DRAFT_508414 [Byssothecium circinans]
MFARLFKKPKLFEVSKDDEENADSETLLPSTPPHHSLVVDKVIEDRRRRDFKVAARTLVLSSALYILIGLWIALSVGHATCISDADEFCIRHVSRYSPLVNEVKPNWRTIQFNGSFLHENVYRGRAGPDVDAAWEALGTDYRSVVIPPEEAEQTGLRSDQVKVASIYGDGYPANVEGLHHLHCLNLLRKSLKWNYDHYQKQGRGPFSNSEHIVRYHVTHCLDILRQQLMCVTDIGVLGQVWWQPDNQDYPEPFVDFNTKHRCRDFEAIRKWAKAHQLPPEEEVDMSTIYQRPNPGDLIYPEIP